MKLPLPVQHQWICDADGRDMLLMDTCSGEDMREIVKRCNAYDAMRDALEAFINAESINNDKRGVETCTYCGNANYHKDAPTCALFMAHNALKLTESP